MRCMDAFTFEARCVAALPTAKDQRDPRAVLRIGLRGHHAMQALQVPPRHTGTGTDERAALVPVSSSVLWETDNRRTDDEILVVLVW